jgi:hypothetical protein
VVPCTSTVFASSEASEGTVGNTSSACANNLKKVIIFCHDHYVHELLT